MVSRESMEDRVPGPSWVLHSWVARSRVVIQVVRVSRARVWPSLLAERVCRRVWTWVRVLVL